MAIKCPISTLFAVKVSKTAHKNSGALIRNRDLLTSLVLSGLFMVTQVNNTNTCPLRDRPPLHDDDDDIDTLQRILFSIINEGGLNDIKCYDVLLKLIMSVRSLIIESYFGNVIKILRFGGKTY